MVAVASTFPSMFVQAAALAQVLSFAVMRGRIQESARSMLRYFAANTVYHLEDRTDKIVVRGLLQDYDDSTSVAGFQDRALPRVISLARARNVSLSSLLVYNIYRDLSNNLALSLEGKVTSISRMLD